MSWFYQTSWLRWNYPRERFGKLSFGTLALRQSELREMVHSYSLYGRSGLLDMGSCQIIILSDK